MKRLFSWPKQLVALFRIKLPKYLRTPATVSLFISCLTALFLLLFYFGLQPVVPLFYSLAQPQDYLAGKQWLVIFPALSFAMNVAHVLFLKAMHSHEEIIQKLYIWVTVVVQILLLLAMVRIMWIVS